MEHEIYPVEAIFPDDRVVLAHFFVWEESLDEPDEVKLTLKLLNREITAHGDNAFRAMQRIRQVLDPEEILLRCYGASKNVYPSPMIESMGPAILAYKLTLGRPALQGDLVSIFDTGSDIQPASVEAQEAFYRKWLSLYSNPL